MSSKEIYPMTWRGLEIDVTYVRSFSNSFERIYGHPLAHLDVEQADRLPLPFTDTGYRSHFTDAADIESAGGPVAYVTAWLDWASKDPAWQGAQLALF